MSTVPIGFPLPNEMIASFFPFLSPSTLLSFKATCSAFKSLVEKDPPSQQRIAECFLRIQPCLEDLKYFCDHSRFAMQIQGDFNVVHLAHNLTSTLSCVSHLIVKNCETNKSLTDLFDLLKKSKRLSALYLFRCKLGEGSLRALLEVTENIKKEDFKIYYSQPMKEPSGDIPSLPPIETLSEEDEQFYIENLEPGNNTLDEFVKEVSDVKASPSTVLEALDTLKSTIKMDVIKSIWNSLLMDPKQDIQNANHITEQTRRFIQESPHHPAIIAAAKTNQQKHAKRDC